MQHHQHLQYGLPQEINLFKGLVKKNITWVGQLIWAFRNFTMQMTSKPSSRRDSNVNTRISRTSVKTTAMPHIMKPKPQHNSLSIAFRHRSSSVSFCDEEEEEKSILMGIEIGGHVEKLNGKQLTYGEFVDKYLAKNQPVVLTGLMDDWLACKDWVTVDGKPDLQFISTNFGKSRVQVADCNTKEFTDQKRVEMSVSEFAHHWLEGSVHEGSDREGNGNSVLYLKDWHFVREYPEYIAYKTPLFFCDDWLNIYLDHHYMHKDSDTYQENNDISCSDYRFVYMGEKGSWTPLHADVFRSYSWSANVCGKKKWLFLSPSQSHLVFDRNMKSCVYNIYEDVSETKFPDFKKAIWLECTQEHNEIIFVPSGWFHQVYNMWDLLLRDYNEAKEYIEDIRDICDDFEGLCQRNLAANTGMNFFDFFIFLTRFFLANMVQLYNLPGAYSNSFWNSSPVVHNFVLNLVYIRKIVLRMKSVGVLAGNDSLCLDLRETLDDPLFLEMSMDLARTYGMIHEQKNLIRDTESALVDFGECNYCIRNPEDLVKFMDYAFANLTGNCSRGTMLLHELGDTFPFCLR